MIYLDHNATTPLDPRVLEAMLPYLQNKWGNPSSRDHAYGWDAQEAVEEARFQIAVLINAKPNEIFFTSGATESILIALHGLYPGESSSEPGLIVSAVEHEAMLGACRSLRNRAAKVETIGVDSQGRIDLAALTTLLASGKTKVVAVMAANNETGVILPFKECAALVQAHGALYFLDAAQALGKIPLDAADDGFDLAAFSAHKLYGPKGIGALYVRGGSKDIKLEPLLPGGGHEGGLRSGTLNVPAIVGFGEACRLAGLELADEAVRLAALRDRLESSLLARIPGLSVNGDPNGRVPNTTNLRFPGIEARDLIRAMNEVAVSTRSACSSGSPNPSHVLKAMGVKDEDAFASIRFSVGRFNTESEIDRTVEIATAAYSLLHSRYSGP